MTTDVSPEMLAKMVLQGCGLRANHHRREYLTGLIVNAVADAVAEARRDALEEAWRVADARARSWTHGAFGTTPEKGDAAIAARAVADAIAALKEPTP